MIKQSLSMAQRLERIPLSKFHYLLLLIIGIPYCFVAMDLLLISLALPSLMQVWNLPQSLAGLLAGSVFIGMSIGATTWGYLADFLGRKRALEFTILIYTVFTGLSAFAWNWESMIILRIITGIGIGGCIPLCFVFLSEFIPAKRRGRFLCLLDSFWAYGWILAALFGFLLIPSLGWKAFFLTGALPIIVLPLIHLTLPESIRYLEEKGKIKEAKKIIEQIETKVGIKKSQPQSYVSSEHPKIPIRELFSQQYRKRTIFSWIMWFCMVYGYYSLFLWIVGFMRGMGYPLPTALFYTLLTSFAQIPGYFSAAWLIEAVGRKPTLTAYLIFTAICTIGFATSGTVIELLIWTSALCFFCLGAWGVVMTYCAEVYPTRVRGTGYGAASGFGRLAGVIGPTIAGFLLIYYGLSITLFVTACIFLIGAVNVIFLGIETKGKILEEISK